MMGYGSVNRLAELMQQFDAVANREAGFSS